MTNWYEKPGGSWLIRLGGIALLGLSALSINELLHLVHQMPLHQATPGELLLALTGFAAASAGCAMATLGRHLFDQVTVSSRWA